MQFNKNNPKVTVGMPLYNRAHVLRETVQQVLDQTFTDFEFIIYNDGSKDNSADIIRAISDERIIFLDKPNMGPPHPLNGILEIARGEYIIILHDHDFFAPELLQKSVDALDKYPGAGFVLQGSAWTDEDGVSNYREMLHDLPEMNNGRKKGEEILLNKKSFSSIFHACSMVRRLAYEAVGKYYSNEYGLYADTDLWFRLLHQFDFVYLKEVLFKFRTREANGHFLSNREFDVLNWNASIHADNLDLYFKDQAERNLMLVKRKRNRVNFDLCLAYAANDNSELLKKGIDLLVADSYKPVRSMVFCTFFYRQSFLQYLLRKGMHKSNQLRKKIG